MRIENPTARAFCEIEAAQENWASREIERQVASLLFERLARSRDKDKVLALAKKGQEVVVSGDVIKDPFVFEFLDLPERYAWLERDIEQAPSIALKSSCWNSAKDSVSWRARNG